MLYTHTLGCGIVWEWVLIDKGNANSYSAAAFSGDMFTQKKQGKGVLVSDSLMPNKTK